jgi:AcrR family transcriptional regulator
MARPVTITDDQILEAARAVFLEEGFNASTATIARRAGISEGTLFKRYETKEKLFFAALQVPLVPPWAAELEGYVGQGNLRRNLVTVCLSIIRCLEDVIPRVMVAWGSRVRRDLFRGMPEPPHLRERRLLAKFLAAEIERGRLGACDPDLVARLLLSSLRTYVQEAFLSGRERTEDGDRIFVEGVVAVLWEGINPRLKRG